MGTGLRSAGRWGSERGAGEGVGVVELVSTRDDDDF